MRRSAPHVAARVVVTAIGADADATLRDHIRYDSPWFNQPLHSDLDEDDVLVDLSASAVHWVDVLMAIGQYQHQPEPPYTPGMEWSGIVTGVGLRAAEKWAVGDRVATEIFSDVSAGARSYSKKYHQFGGFATQAIAHAEGLRRIPDGWSAVQAACFGGAFETAYHALIHVAKLQPGERVCIVGATGACGLAAAQICRAIGCPIVAAGGSPAKLERVRAIVDNADLPADPVVAATHSYLHAGEEGGGASSSAETTTRQCVRKWGGKTAVHSSETTTRSNRNVLRDAVRGAGEEWSKGADVVFDTVGGDVGQQALRASAFGARICIVGWTSTPFAGGGRGAGADHATGTCAFISLLLSPTTEYLAVIPADVHANIGHASRYPLHSHTHLSILPKANAIPTNIVQMKGLHVLGCPVAIHTRFDPSIRVPRMQALAEWVRDGLIVPHVDATFPLKDAADALRAKWGREIVGGCAVICDGSS